jgi:Protein of unknown function (DUF2478)
MSKFASELVEAGVDARGIVQLPPSAEGCGPGALMKLRDVAIGEIIPLCQNLGPGAPSHVVRAKRVPCSAAHGVVRFSLSRDNADADIDRVVDPLPSIIAVSRAGSPFLARQPSVASAYAGAPCR